MLLRNYIQQRLSTNCNNSWAVFCVWERSQKWWILNLVTLLVYAVLSWNNIYLSCMCVVLQWNNIGFLKCSVVEWQSPFMLCAWWSILVIAWLLQNLWGWFAATRWWHKQHCHETDASAIRSACKTQCWIPIIREMQTRMLKIIFKLSVISLNLFWDWYLVKDKVTYHLNIVQSFFWYGLMLEVVYLVADKR